jgi:CHAT domain-containing protein
MLGAALLDAALADLPPSVTGLVIVPDGALHRVPFDALILRGGRHVVVSHATSIAPSATVAARLWRQRRTPTAGPVLALADPEPVTAGPAAGLPRLRASRREARLVARFAAGSTVRLGRDASETWLKHASLPQYRVLHFATHARADEASLSGTAIALTPGAGEDGLLGPGELGRLTLDADLVVLSSCRSGAGVVVRGEGIVGLAAPLIEAGARAVALTRWAIGDQETVGLIAAFYGALASGQTAGPALRTAKLAAITRGASPAVWAAFTIVGDPTVTVPLAAPRPRVPVYWWWIGGAAVVALLAGWARGRLA